jgi:hypothetical protein
VIVRARAACSAVALALLVPVAAAAQGRPNPFADLFGRVPDRPGGAITRVDFRSTAGAQWADIGEHTADNGDGVPDGLAGRADGELQLLHLGTRLQSQGHARYMYQEYRREPVFGSPGYDAGGQVVLKATNKILIDAGGQFTHAPFFHILPTTSEAFGWVAPPGGDPFIAYLIDNDSFEGHGGITAEYTKRSSVSLSGRWMETRFANSSADNFSMRGFRGQWRRRMTRDFAVHVAYARDEMRQRRLGDDRFMNELFDIGVDFSKALPIAQRTTLSFSTETSALRENEGKRHYRLNGAVELQHGFNRTWQAVVGGYRATEFLPGFAAPLLSDRARAGVSGYLSKRFIFYGNVFGQQSQIGLQGSDRFVTYSGDARLTFAMTRHFGLFGQYVRYYYQLPLNADAVVRLPKLSRQTYVFGIQTWVPLINKAQVTSDPR